MPPALALRLVPSLQPAAGEAGVDRPSFDQVYAEYFDLVYRSLRRLGVSAAALDDAAQDVFLVVHRRLGEFEARSSMRTWIYGIALRTAANYRRTAARRRTDPLPPDLPGQASHLPEALTEAAQAARLVQALLEGMDEDRRTVFVLAELEQLTAPEISALVGANLNTVYSRLRLARREFQGALAAHRARRPE